MKKWKVSDYLLVAAMVTGGLYLQHVVTKKDKPTTPQITVVAPETPQKQTQQQPPQTLQTLDEYLTEQSTRYQNQTNPALHIYETLPLEQWVTVIPNPRKQNHDFTTDTSTMLLARCLRSEMGAELTHDNIQGFEAAYLVSDTIINRTQGSRWWSRNVQEIDNNDPTMALHRVVLKSVERKQYRVHQYSWLNVPAQGSWRDEDTIANYDATRDPLRGIVIGESDSWNRVQRQRVAQWVKCYLTSWDQVHQWTNNTRRDRSHGATHYHNLTKKFPSWAEPDKMVLHTTFPSGKPARFYRRRN